MSKLKQLVFNSGKNNNSSSSPQSEIERNPKYPEFRIAPNFEGSAIHVFGKISKLSNIVLSKCFNHFNSGSTLLAQTHNKSNDRPKARDDFANSY